MNRDLTPAQREWLAKQNTTSTGDASRDRMIAQSIAGRFFREFPRARRFCFPESLQWAFEGVDDTESAS